MSIGISLLVCVLMVICVPLVAITVLMFVGGMIGVIGFAIGYGAAYLVVSLAEKVGIL
jgi:hypothetical protein